MYPDEDEDIWEEFELNLSQMQELWLGLAQMEAQANVVFRSELVH